MKFKVGDKVRDLRDNKVGTIIPLECLLEDSVCAHDHTIEYDEGGSNCCDEVDMVLISNGKDKQTKQLPAQFIVIYDLVDRDPVKTFTSKKELHKWFKEAKDDKDVIFSSIKIFEVKREYTVQTSFRLKKK